MPLIQRRIAWAKFYLNAAGFIQHRSRNLIQITEDGHAAVESGNAAGRCFLLPARGGKNLGQAGSHPKRNLDAQKTPAEARVDGWLMGFEPTTPGTTIQCSNQLSYSHRLPQKGAQR